MNWPLKIARRYLFAKKSTNAINIISGISVFGISVGSAALILVLSVFNGFEDLITDLFGAFNPDVKIIPIKGKTFQADTATIAQLQALEGVDFVAQTLEEVAFFEYKGSQDFGILKGVDESFVRVTDIDSTVREGIYKLRDGQREMMVFGVGMRNKLSINVDDELATVGVYMAKRKASALGNPFRKSFAYPVGTFVIQPDFDNQYVLCSLDFARSILKAKGEISALEVRLNPTQDKDRTMNAIRQIMGDDFLVRDRYQQDEAFLKLMNIEKWISFAILSLTLVLVAFNMIGSLWMIVLDKKQDIAILKSMGASNGKVRNIFLSEGLLLCLLGLFIGSVAALILYVIQRSFGIVPIPAGFVVDAYPISIRWLDFVVVALTVIAIGLLASLPPAYRAARVPAIIRES